MTRITAATGRLCTFVMSNSKPTQGYYPAVLQHRVWDELKMLGDFTKALSFLSFLFVWLGFIVCMRVCVCCFLFCVCVCWWFSLFCFKLLTSLKTSLLMTCFAVHASCGKHLKWKEESWLHRHMGLERTGEVDGAVNVTLTWKGCKEERPCSFPSKESHSGFVSFSF